MIPILYDSNEIAFESNGLGRLRDCIECRVVEGRNDVYECDFSYPVDGANFDLIKLGRIIGVTHDEATFDRPIRYRSELTDEQDDILTDENGVAFTGSGTKMIPERDIQPFDIVSYSRPINGVVTFHCTHISYRQSKMVTYASGVNSLSDAFDAFDTVFFPDNPLGLDAGGNPFTYITDKFSTGYCSAFDGTPKSIRSLLGGVEGSILDTYGGEFEWDKWFVKLHSERGEKREVTIRYGVNMTDFKDDTDYSESFNTCVPFWKDSSTDAVVIGSEVLSGHDTIGIGNKCVPLDLTDKFEEQPTVAQLEEMATAVLNEQQPYLPTQTINLDFVRLQDEAGFDQFDSLLQCKLCDSIKVVFPGYGISAYYKIVKTVWNVLLDRYDEMELGNLSTTLAEALGISSSVSGASGGSGTDAAAVVVASGTDGIWNYRKWSDGTSECWGIWAGDLTHYATVGSFYGFSTTVYFPSGLFNARPTVCYNSQVANGFSLTGATLSVTASSMGLYALGQVGNTQTCTFDIQVKGRWK